MHYTKEDHKVFSTFPLCIAGELFTFQKFLRSPFYLSLSLWLRNEVIRTALHILAPGILPERF